MNCRRCNLRTKPSQETINPAEVDSKTVYVNRHRHFLPHRLLPRKTAHGFCGRTAAQIYSDIFGESFATSEATSTALTASMIEYIKAKEEHHGRTTFEEEYRKLLAEAGIQFNEKYMF